jgi:hypothetical protein
MNMLAAVPSPSSYGGMVAVEEARAAQEVQAMCAIAQRFPRDLTQCYVATMKELERFSLAKVSLYAYKRGKGTVSGPTIRLVEVVARNFRNLKYGFREMTRRDGVSDCEAFCWDLEANNFKLIPFQVRHIRDTQQGGKPVTDERDIYELVANFGTRRMRNCIQAMIPSYMMEDFIAKVGETIAIGEKSIPLEQRVNKMVLAFDAEFKVSKEMIEKKYKHKIEQINKDEFVELFAIYNSLKEGAPREEFFEFASDLATTPQDIERDKADALREEQRLVMVANVHQLKQKFFDSRGESGDTIIFLESQIGCALSEIDKLPLEKLVAVIDILKKI